MYEGLPQRVKAYAQRLFYSFPNFNCGVWQVLKTWNYFGALQNKQFPIHWKQAVQIQNKTEAQWQI